MGKPYRLKKGRISRPEKGGRKLYEPGDIVQMSDEQLASFHGELEPIHAAQAPKKKKSDSKTEKPKRTPAAELVEAIAKSDSVDELSEILALEVADANRKSVVEAANAKLEELAKGV